MPDMQNARTLVGLQRQASNVGKRNVRRFAGEERGWDRNMVRRKDNASIRHERGAYRHGRLADQPERAKRQQNEEQLRAVRAKVDEPADNHFPVFLDGGVNPHRRAGEEGAEGEQGQMELGLVRIGMDNGHGARPCARGR